MALLLTVGSVLQVFSCVCFSLHDSLHSSHPYPAFPGIPSGHSLRLPSLGTRLAPASDLGTEGLASGEGRTPGPSPKQLGSLGVLLDADGVFTSRPPLSTIVQTSPEDGLADLL